ncbi:methyltransferase domain-containing protein [Azospirillum brasilense]|uniref:methyltransferase domain-containing protein n=1 Tax=Azospirillum brasilense TaxID=192 RepID=UPI00190A8111|nr:methyltransferase domain-containing protein [Azospirillum brasilense]MBK3736567.1 methyltransferase domain-containing protein [Azospirillum brasilense]
MDRNEIIRSMINTSGLGLEIGASYNPVMPKRDGYNIRIADYAGHDYLRKLHNLSSDHIEDVDYVTNGGPVSKAVEEENCFDYIVASHMIEHCVDFIGFLKDCETLLKPDGALVLVVPDKRNCFDVFQSLSSVGEMLDIHQKLPRKHASGKLFDHLAYAGGRNGHIVWPHGCPVELGFVHSLPEALAAFQLAEASDEYRDCHSWRFTPSSFRLIVNDLHEIGSVRLKEKGFREGNGPEFYVSLSFDGQGVPVSRIDLAKNIIREISEIIVN